MECEIKEEESNYILAIWIVSLNTTSFSKLGEGVHFPLKLFVIKTTN